MKALLNSKLFWLTFLIGALNIPLAMIENQVEQRSEQRSIAENSVRSSWTGEQIIYAGLLTIPWEEQVDVETTTREGTMLKKQWVPRLLTLVAENVNLKSELKTQILNKGIYGVPVYTANTSIKLRWLLAPFHQLEKKNIRFTKPAYFSIGLSDVRGITGKPRAVIAKTGDSLLVQPGTKTRIYASGFSSQLEQQLLDKKELSVSVDFKFKGMSSINFVAVGRDNTVSVNSNWPHPNFQGAFLPVERSVSGQGYQANWQTGVFATDIENQIKSCATHGCETINNTKFGVKNIRSVDIYLQSLRSVKYGILIILVTFSVFFLFETLLKDLKIHPIAYALAGFALAIFFLLLLALSEHLSFAYAYWIAAICCSSLIGFYIAKQIRSAREGMITMLVLNLLYLVLFFIIKSEDYALLSGSLLLFALLSLIMYLTRNLDWYRVTNKG